MEHAQIIDDLALLLGGQAALGKRMGVKNSTICHWKEDGIPARHWVRLLEVAKARRYPLTLAKIHKHSPLNPRHAKPVNGV